jgi:hypothetical protein
MPLMRLHPGGLVSEVRGPRRAFRPSPLLPIDTTSPHRATVARSAEENTAATEEMAGQASRVMDAVQNIAAVSEEQTTSTEEVSASTDQVKQMSAQAQELAVTAEQFPNLVTRFKLDDRAAAAAIVPPPDTRLRIDLSHGFPSSDRRARAPHRP